ncbi:hypothetical protein N0V88_002717 [Collariella sp. IMI 366227]|nr:hypothetical protein N0V88_002717 [Collariella sp. IMI 366227]
MYVMLPNWKIEVSSKDFNFINTGKASPGELNRVKHFAPSSSGTRWSLRLSLLAGTAAVVLALQPTLLPKGILQHLQTTPGAGEPDKTYCYQSLRTVASVAPDTENKLNCFSVSPSTGTFTRIFSSSTAESGSEKYELLPGHVLPGLWDGHGHLMQYGEFLHSADLFGADSKEEVRRRLREYVRANPGVGTRGDWVRGVGWDQMVLGDADRGVARGG